jgi:hypothetical protein
MKKIWWGVFGAGLILTAAAFQNAPPDEVRLRDIQTLTGTVKSYSPDSRIVLVTADGAEHSLKLDEGARVANGVAEGQMVAVAWFRESTGNERVTSVAPFSAPASGGEASSAPPSKAYAATSEGAAMSATPAGPMSETPRPAPTSPSTMDLTPGVRTTGTPGASMRETPGPPVRPTPMGGSF